jgi:hypothetical protein
MSYKNLRVYLQEGCSNRIYILVSKLSFTAAVTIAGLLPVMRTDFPLVKTTPVSSTACRVTG